MQELDTLRSERERFEKLGQELKESGDFLALGAPATDEAAELERELASIEKAIAEWQFQLLLGGPHARSDAILTVRSGAGGTEAQDWAEMLLRMYLRFAERRGWSSAILDETRGAEAGIKSATLEISGPHAFGYLRAEAGIHRLVRLSPFNANHLRQTSFAAVEVIPVIPESEAPVLKPEELRVDTFRASGAGGQHVNKTESAVRLTHLPTGLVVACQSERSQTQNRQRATKILLAKIVARELETKKAEQAKLRGTVKSAEWGNQIRSYVLHPYNLVKDHRTATETSDTASVLDGNLDKFIESALQYLYQTE